MEYLDFMRPRLPYADVRDAYRPRPLERWGAGKPIPYRSFFQYLPYG